jgi:Tol biopolymer transport system component
MLMFRPGWGRQVAPLLLASIFATAACFVGEHPAAATYPGANGRIVFSNGTDELWSILPDGRGLRRLTTVKSSSSLSFVSFPSVSADGSTIAVMLNELQPTSAQSVVVMNADGSNQRVVFSSPRIVSLDLALSPDGRHIALTLSNVNAPGESIYVLRIKGRRRGHDHGERRHHQQLRRLTRPTGTNLFVTDTFGRWSPDGKTVTFESNRDTPTTGSSWSVFAVAVGNRRISRIMPASTGNDLEPDWSPDGTKVTFVRTFAFPDYRIYTVNRDGTNQREVVRDSSADEIPAFSPDGRQIAYLRSHQIWLVNADGTNPHQLVNGGSYGFTWVPQSCIEDRDDDSPRTSPDRVAAITARSDDCDGPDR